jgi:hypothetical protein
MIASILVNDILDLVLDDVEDSDKYRQQIAYLTIGDVEHTGVGLYLFFTKNDEINKYKAQNMERLRLEGVELINESLGILADTIVYIENGLIDCIEIWNKSGNDYPQHEPINYQLKQMWLDNPKRRIIER